MDFNDDRVTPKQRRIIDAARFLVLRQGLRATTMEAIAREARMAKPTLYDQYTDKDAVFSAVVEDIAETICGTFDKEIEGEANVAERVGNALCVKFCAIAKLLGDSPHAEEFFGTQHRTSERFEMLDKQTETAVSNAFKQEGLQNARALARLVIASAYGIGRKFNSEADIRKGIMLMCQNFIG